MNTSSHAHELLRSYGEMAGLPALQFDLNGCARLLFEDETAIDLEVDEPAGCIQLYAVLGAVPAGGRETLYRSLLEGNLFGSHTSGASLAIDPVQEEVLLCRRAQLGITTPELLSDLLQAFAAAAAQWKQKFASGELAGRGDGGNTVAGEWQGSYLRG